MICLPPLPLDGRPGSLPAADRSALVLAELLVTGEDREAVQERLRAALAVDPPLTLWALILARQSPGGGDAPADCLSLAQWLIDHADAVLHWPKEAQPPEQAEQQRAAEGVAQALARAHLGTAIAAARGGDAAAVERVRLAGMLGRFEAGLPDGIDLVSPIIDGLDDDLRGVLADVDALLDNPKRLSDDAGGGVAASLAAAERAAAAWREPVGDVGRWLPLLACRMGRLRSLHDHFEAAVEHEKIEALAEFAAGAGHEINNPLTVISGRAQLLLRGEQDPERRHDLALISAQAMRVNEMIADLRLFARPPEPKPERFDLAAMLDRLAEQLGPEAAGLEITFQRAGRGDPTPIRADPVQIEVAVRALCRNAVEAIGRQGRVELGLSIQRGGVRVEVSDDGPGMTEPQRRHAFDPFYSARQAGRGLGLGLAKAWRIVTAHGGRIDVQSEPGRGTVFRITLPRDIGEE